jgi:hypothetical protein
MKLPLSAMSDLDSARRSRQNASSSIRSTASHLDTAVLQGMPRVPVPSSRAFTTFPPKAEATNRSANRYIRDMDNVQLSAQVCGGLLSF